MKRITLSLAVATSGDRRLVAAAFLGLLLTPVVAGCGGGSPHAIRPAPVGTTSSGAADSPPPLPPGSPSSPTGCPSTASPALDAMLKDGWSRPWAVDLVPFDGSNAAGTEVAANERTRGSSRIVLLDLATHKVARTIATLTPDAQAGGVFDGEHVIWKESTVGQLDPFVVKLWTAATGRVDVVGRSHPMPSGDVASSPWEDPVLAGGRAAWVEGTDAAGAGEIVQLDLTSHRRTIAHSGHVGWIALSPSALIWAESDRPGAYTTIHAQDPRTGAPVATPEPLAHADGAWGFVTDGTYWAWIATDREMLHASPELSSDPPALYGGPVGGEAHKIASIPLHAASPPLAISHGMVTVPVSPGGLVFADVSTGAWSYAKRASWATSLADGLLVSRMRQKGRPPGTSLAVVRPESVAGLHC